MVSQPPGLPAQYRVVRELGRGGMATVYLAEDAKHHRAVAIKVLHPELSSAIGADRFQREVELTANLQHPHILPLFDSGTADGSLYYVMPYVEGESLRDRLARQGRLAVDEALGIAEDVASALTWAHEHGVVHRDVKPENILLAGSEALVADFGIALATRGARDDRLTGTGLSLGTPAYMSPEQIAGDRQVDGRADVYALGCVLHEMLAGRPPFTADTAHSVLAQALVDPPPPVRGFRAEVPPAVERALLRALEKEPRARFATPREFVAACRAGAPAPMPRTRRLAWGAAMALALVAVVWPLWKSRQAERARASLPRIATLAAQGAYVEALRLAESAERAIPGDTVLQGLLDEVADLLTVTSEPAGAAVEVQRLAEAGEPESAAVALGVTPIVSRRVARAEYRVSLRLPGRAVAERIASSAYGRSVNLPRDGRVVTLHVAIPSRDSVPDDVVLVPGGARALRNPDLPLGLTAQLQPFVIDRYEVTNDAFRAFVRGGGYAERAHWPEWTGPGSPAERLVDRTGLPAPRGWRAQSPPEGAGTHPVTGVSWYEAAAFCRSRGMRLPTLFEWDQAGRPDADRPLEVMMPWGAMSAIGAADRRANFRGSGTMPVGSHPFGVSPWGAHDMAGNVKEWLANAVGQGFAFTGGSWQDPAYLFTEVGALEPGAANASLGFRCARTHGPGRGDQGAMPLRLGQAAPVYRAVDAATYRSFLNFYRYDPRAPRARGLQRTETPEWTRERLWIDGVGTDSILVYLYLPRQATPPFQTIVSVPSSAAFFFQPVWRAVEDDLGPHVANGRAVLAIVFDGMLERNAGVTGARPAPSSVEFRDLMVRHATELRMGMDYLATRAEIDTAKLAYHGVSWGAGSRLGFAAVDDRFKAVVLVGAGIDERVQPTLPEAANFNFAPHIRAPKLMVNGRQDEEHPWATRAKPLWDLLREPKELVLADGVGHHPPAEVMVPAVRSFLDRVLGPVTVSSRSAARDSTGQGSPRP